MRNKLKTFPGLVALLMMAGSMQQVHANDTLTAKHNTDYIDPTIGNMGQLLEPTRPTVHLPNQMIRFTPQRRDYMDDQISSFPLTVVSHRLGQVFAIKPTIDAVTPGAWKKRMTYDHGLEINKPWYYSTYLIDDGITVEFTAAKKAGMFRFSFPEAAQKSLLFGAYNGGESSWNFADGKVVTGMETWHDDVKIYVYGVLSTAGEPGIIQNAQPQPGNHISGTGSKAYISFPAGTKAITLSYAISFISAEQAKKNFAEINGKSFAAVEANGKQAWDNIMDQIAVEGGTDVQKRAFYTALYRCHERMTDITEDGAYYSGYDKKIHNDKRTFYVDDWSWDTYLALHPLRMILHPAQEEDMLQSYVNMYAQSGWMPTFPVLFGDHACMNGFHSSIVFLDAYRKGLRNFDTQKAFEGMKKNATDATLLPWRNGEKTVLDDYYHTHGYFPALPPGAKETVPEVHPFEKRQAVAVTLGAAYDDWALSQMAGELGKKADAATFAPRGENYRNLWNAERQFFLPKDDQGNWINIDPAIDGGMGGREYYDENNGWTYLWQVQQNIPGLIDLMGGKQAFEKRLDQLYREQLGMSKYAFWNKFPDATGLVGQYSMGNEPSFHIPYLYNFTDAPWKTQQRVRFLLDVWFRDNIFSIPGDEDGGGMSAFVVFSSMGFYPVTPGLPAYTIGSPLFKKITIHQPGGRDFVVNAHDCSNTNKYIQRAAINGKALNTPWFTHQQLTSGATVDLWMGDKPNKAWGKGNGE
ncbi:GH92 family glycosyl hydrolase [Deminuibacter soli]|uniref:Glycoside hydrolase family 92 protein n=1 Tax=Deminuibacter soli TaxID=2291815 RepID=A0A3E1NKN6_9BACT|nr:GH92 family glycosyl hydrolase [Deminuibacter soli]RFM28500.1 glycoside hydrolase family 92 protein [Deminuibacter soli]